MKIILVRHGETYANLDPKKPATLTRRGKHQVDVVARHLRKVRVDAIYSSNLERALATAKEIHRFKKGSPLIVDERLGEVYRVIVGETSDKPFDGKRFRKDTKRATAVWKELTSLKKKAILVVCHANIIRFFLALALGVRPKQGLGFAIANASVTIIDVVDGKKFILLVNDINHIPMRLISDRTARSHAFRYV